MMFKPPGWLSEEERVRMRACAPFVDPPEPVIELTDHAAAADAIITRLTARNAKLEIENSAPWRPDHQPFALERHNAKLEAVREALEALGCLPEGCCFCALNWDPIKNLRGEPHTVECENARKALAALKALGVEADEIKT